jgi:CheY-like chemotaxis protein
MAFALICSMSSLDDELGLTLLWREEIERSFAPTAEAAVALASRSKPDIIVIDRDLSHATRLVSDFRRDPRTRRVSIVIFARTDFEAVEVDLLEAGANAVLRLPASLEWDDRLARLVTVPVRREVRLPVQFELETGLGCGVEASLALVVNLSVSGLLLETERELKMGDDLDLRFQLAELGATVVGCGRIVRHAGRRRYGVEFYGLEGDGADLVRRYVELVDIPE